MNSTKKDRPKAGTSEQSCPGLASANNTKVIITNFQRIASPNLDRGGGVFPYGPGLDPGCDWRGLRDLRPDACH